MKFTFTIIIAFSYLIVFSQIKQINNLHISFPHYFKAYTIVLKNSNTGKVETIAYKNEKYINTNIINNNNTKEDQVLGIYLKNNNIGIIDTLYFINKNKQCQIAFIDSFDNAKNNKFMRLTNIYNFEDLYSSYVDINKTPTYPNILTEKKFTFLKNNINNPYTIDLFLYFVMNDIDVDYASLHRFYNDYLIKKITDKNYKVLIEKAINSKQISNAEHVQIPHFVSETINHKIIDSYEFKGKYVLLNFWATWCQPYIAEIPSLIEIRQTYGEDKLDIISISLDNKIATLKAMIATKKLTWLHIFNDSNLRTIFGINPIPHTFLIDPNGIIIYNSLSRKDETFDLKQLKFILSKKITK